MPFLKKQNGAWCPNKIAAFTGVLLPAAWLIGRFWTEDLGARPVTEAIHFTGDWAVRLLWITLAVTPFARIFRMPRWLLARRTLGVASFTYVFAHLSLYVLDQKFDLVVVASEIAMRFYLTIGFIGVVALATLTATSTDRHDPPVLAGRDGACCTGSAIRRLSLPIFISFCKPRTMSGSPS